MIPLNQIQVPKPCGEDWDAMDGDARRRFCAGCGCHVHDLSVMTERAAQELLDQADGRLCVRFQTRHDGTVLTQDMPRPVERRVVWPRPLAAAASWALALVVAGLGLSAGADSTPKHVPQATPKAHTTAPGGRRSRATVGKVAPPRPLLLPTMGMVAQPHRPPAPQPLATMGAPLAPPMMGDVAPRPSK